MKNSILKSWKTTAVGLVMLAYLVYQLFWKDHQMDIQMIIMLLAGAGFVASKDSSDSHTKR